MSEHNYKNTLNLPKTAFPMKANLVKREPEILAKWADIKLYESLRKQGKNRQKFIFHDGPPYANGEIHLGHAVNKTLKDIVVKSRTLSGYDAPFVPGWDCHGLPIEIKVEKKAGKPGKDISREDFRAACRKYAASQIDLQRDAFRRLGVIADWENPYITMDFKYEADVIRSLASIIENGHLHQGFKPVLWCLECSSALAEAEAEYQDKTSPAIDVAYFFKDIAVLKEKLDLKDNSVSDVVIPIWTTTPWTLPASEAVAVHPEIDYALVKVTDTKHYVIANDLVEKVLARYEILTYEVISVFKGNNFEGMQVKHPFYDKTLPIVLGDHVTVDAGTGAVHTAPAHGVDDYRIGKLYDLPTDSPVADNGCFVDSKPVVAGLFVRKVDGLILAELTKCGTLIHQAKVSHSYPHCWRHKTPLIFRATPQWFISMTANSLRDHAVTEAQQVKWIPDWGFNRMRLMLNNRPDWCISRQRAWGVPIPLFLHKETGRPHPNSVTLIEEVAKIVEQSGIESWDNINAKDMIGDDYVNYRKSTDVLDVWFDSGVSHKAVLSSNSALSFPADLYLEGSDQYRGWFQSSLLSSVAMRSVAPYKAVLTHGFIVDSNGHKMSKSLGNVVAPDKLFKKFGADVLRLWVASTDYRSEMTVSDEVFTRASETYRRIRNTCRFLLANIDGFDPDKHMVEFNNQLELDRWVLDAACRLQDEIFAAYESYSFHLIVQKVHNFCSIELGGFYLDIIKDRQYTLQENSLARRSAQTAIFHILEALVRWVAPVLSFTADEIWQHIPGERDDSVFLHTWYVGLQKIDDSTPMNSTFWQDIREVRDAVNLELEVQRKAGLIGSALEASVTLFCDSNLKQRLDMLGNELRFVLITSAVAVCNLNELTDAVETDYTGLFVKVTPLDVPKCERCWHRCSDVGESSEHPKLCGRCINNVEGVGEARVYA